MSEKLVKCPFNSQHVMTESSLQRHIIRCMVNYPNYEVCPYNALHRFQNKNLLADHMMKCDSRAKAHVFHEVNENSNRRDQALHIDNAREFNLQFENWDEEYEN